MKVAEIFASIQGEGRFIGEPQVFVRMSGCNMRCTWCDTKYAWEAGRENSVEEIIGVAESYGLKSVCITGGEPLLQAEELLALIRTLKDDGYKILLETNGSIYDIQVFNEVDHVALDMKPPSSGEKSDEMILSRLRPCDYIKIVVDSGEDFEFAKKIIGKSGVEVFLQPSETAKFKWLADKVLEEKLNVKILPQLHKVMGFK
ncbi:MAG: 7-carboxy-7-deazaguanine synthase QueE [Candidatus Altiarchaeota archaeon]